MSIFANCGQRRLWIFQTTHESLAVGFPAALNGRQIGKATAGIYTRWDDALYRSCLQRFGLSEKKRSKDFSRGTKMKLATKLYRPKEA